MPEAEQSPEVIIKIDSPNIEFTSRAVPSYGEFVASLQNITLPYVAPPRRLGGHAVTEVTHDEQKLGSYFAEEIKGMYLPSNIANKLELPTSVRCLVFGSLEEHDDVGVILKPRNPFAREVRALLFVPDQRVTNNAGELVPCMNSDCLVFAVDATWPKEEELHNDGTRSYVDKLSARRVDDEIAQEMFRIIQARAGAKIQQAAQSPQAPRHS